MLIGVSCMVDERFSAVTTISARPASLAGLAVEAVVWASTGTAEQTAPTSTTSAGMRRYEYIDFSHCLSLMFSADRIDCRAVLCRRPRQRALGNNPFSTKAGG